MHILLCGIIKFFLTCESLALILATITAYSQEAKSIPPVAFVVKLGITDDGAVVSDWVEAIRQRHDEEALSAIQASKKKLSDEEVL